MEPKERFYSDVSQSEAPEFSSKKYLNENGFHCLGPKFYFIKLIINQSFFNMSCFLAYFGHLIS